MDDFVFCDDFIYLYLVDISPLTNAQGCKETEVEEDTCQTRDLPLRFHLDYRINIIITTNTTSIPVTLPTTTHHIIRPPPRSPD
jgi:hypothetical protein